MSTFDGGGLAEAALQDSTSTHCQVIVQHTANANVRWAANSLTTNGVTHDAEATVIAFDHRRDGIAVASVSAALVHDRSLRDLVRSADAAAALAPLADDASDFPAVSLDADFSTGAEAIEASVLSACADGVGDLATWASASGIETFGFAEADVTTTWFASTSGTRRRHQQPSERFEVTAKSHGRTRSTWFGAPHAAPDWNGLRADLTRALTLQAHTIDVAPGRYTTILPPSATADLMIDLMWSAGAQDAAEGRTAFHDAASPTRTRIGTDLGDHRFTLASTPDDPLAPCQPFALVGASGRFGSVFDNGADLARTRWIDRGRLAHLIASSADQRRYGVPHAPMIDTLRAEVAGATAPGVDELAGRLDDGLLLTCIWYVRSVDPMTMLLTGLTRDGVYVVRGGEIIGAAGNYRFNDTPLGMLTRIRDASRPQRTLPREMADYANRVVTPALTIDAVNFTSASEAR